MSKSFKRLLSSVLAFVMAVTCLTVVNVGSVFAADNKVDVSKTNEITLGTKNITSVTAANTEEAEYSGLYYVLSGVENNYWNIKESTTYIRFTPSADCTLTVGMNTKGGAYDFANVSNASDAVNTSKVGTNGQAFALKADTEYKITANDTTAKVSISYLKFEPSSGTTEGATYSITGNVTCTSGTVTGISVTATLDGATVGTADVTNGTYTFSDLTKTGTYSISYAGDDTYNASETSATATIAEDATSGTTVNATDLVLTVKSSSTTTTTGTTYKWYADPATDGSNYTNDSCFTVANWSSKSDSGNLDSTKVTINGTDYTLTKRSKDTTSVTIVVPDDVTNASLYMVAKSNGSTTRNLTLKKNSDSIDTSKSVKDIATVEYTGLSGGTYTLTSDGSMHVALLVLVTDGTSSGEDTKATYNVSVTVQDESENPITGATVTSGTLEATYDSTSGAYVFSGVEEGTELAISVSKDGYYSGSATVTVSSTTANNKATVTLKASTSTVVSGDSFTFNSKSEDSYPKLTFSNVDLDGSQAKLQSDRSIKFTTGSEDLTMTITFGTSNKGLTVTDDSGNTIKATDGTTTGTKYNLSKNTAYTITGANARNNTNIKKLVFASTSGGTTTATYSITGTVVDGNGDTLTGAAVTATVGGEAYSAITVKNGVYTISGLKAGDEVVITPSCTGYEAADEADRTVTVSDDVTMNLTLTKKSSSTTTGTVAVSLKVNNADSTSTTKVGVTITKKDGSAVKVNSNKISSLTFGTATSLGSFKEGEVLTIKFDDDDARHIYNWSSDLKTTDKKYTLTYTVGSEAADLTMDYYGDYNSAANRITSGTINTITAYGTYAFGEYKTSVSGNDNLANYASISRYSNSLYNIGTGDQPMTLNSGKYDERVILRSDNEGSYIKLSTNFSTSNKVMVLMDVSKTEVTVDIDNSTGSIYEKGSNTAVTTLSGMNKKIEKDGVTQDNKFVFFITGNGANLKITGTNSELNSVVKSIRFFPVGNVVKSLNDNNTSASAVLVRASNGTVDANSPFASMVSGINGTIYMLVGKVTDTTSVKSTDFTSNIDKVGFTLVTVANAELAGDSKDGNPDVLSKNNDVDSTAFVDAPTATIYKGVFDKDKYVATDDSETEGYKGTDVLESSTDYTAGYFAFLVAVTENTYAYPYTMFAGTTDEAYEATGTTNRISLPVVTE